MYDEWICMSSGFVCTHTHSHISNRSKPTRYYNWYHFTAQLTVTFNLTLKCTKSNAKKWDLLTVQWRCSLCLLVSIFVLSVFAKLLACDEMLYLLSINFTAFGWPVFNLLIKRPGGWKLYETTTAINIKTIKRWCYLAVQNRNRKHISHAAYIT